MGIIVVINVVEGETVFGSLGVLTGRGEGWVVGGMVGASVGLGDGSSS